MKTRTTILVLGTAFVASLFSLVGLWFARALPGEPLPGDAEEKTIGPAEPSRKPALQT